ncbi:MAG: flavodoxin domain-containing protein [Spirochaetes bacterium]|nr:flavodoxin domain-containing protein [Spirochaetota bacterium]
MILYASEYGTTKQISQELANLLNCQAYPYDAPDLIEKITDTSFLILASDVLLLKINKGFLRFIKSQKNLISQKKIGILLVCGSPDDKEINGVKLGISQYIPNFPEDIVKQALLIKAINGKIDFEITDQHKRMIEIMKGHFLVEPFDATPLNDLPGIAREIKKKLG